MKKIIALLLIVLLVLPSINFAEELTLIDTKECLEQALPVGTELVWNLYAFPENVDLKAALQDYGPQIIATYSSLTGWMPDILSSNLNSIDFETFSKLTPQELYTLSILACFSTRGYEVYDAEAFWQESNFYVDEIERIQKSNNPIIKEAVNKAFQYAPATFRDIVEYVHNYELYYAYYERHKTEDKLDGVIPTSEYIKAATNFRGIFDPMNFFGQIQAGIFIEQRKEYLSKFDYNSYFKSIYAGRPLSYISSVLPDSEIVFYDQNVGDIVDEWKLPNLSHNSDKLYIPDRSEAYYGSTVGLAMTLPKELSYDEAFEFWKERKLSLLNLPKDYDMMKVANIAVGLNKMTSQQFLELSNQELFEISLFLNHVLYEDDFEETLYLYRANRSRNNVDALREYVKINPKALIAFKNIQSICFLDFDTLSFAAYYGEDFRHNYGRSTYYHNWTYIKKKTLANIYALREGSM